MTLPTTAFTNSAGENNEPYPLPSGPVAVVPLPIHLAFNFSGKVVPGIEVVL